VERKRKVGFVDGSDKQIQVDIDASLILLVQKMSILENFLQQVAVSTVTKGETHIL